MEIDLSKQNLTQKSIFKKISNKITKTLGVYSNKTIQNDNLDVKETNFIETNEENDETSCYKTEIKLCCPRGPTGPTGIGAPGNTGPTGTPGIEAPGNTGPPGPTGPVGQNAAISSIFVWSSILQLNKNISNFQYVTFENTPIGPTGSGWTAVTEPGYINPTNFIVPTNGFYLLTYKLDVRSGGGNTPTSKTDCSTVLTQNNIQINGSATLVEAPESNHIYTISNTVLTDLFQGDSISLLFWSNDLGTHIGDPTFLTGRLPNGTVPTEATASIVFTKIS